MENDWNINKGFGDVLIKLIVDVNNAASVGDTKLWFNSLRILFRNVAGHKKMREEVIKKLNTDLKNLKNKLSTTPAMTEQGKAYKKILESDIKDKLDDINITLITEMHKADIILPIRKNTPETASLEM